MAIISENNPSGYRRYSNSQFRYALVYVLVTLAVLLFLNIYCFEISKKLFYQEKEASMIEQCQLAAAEITAMEVINAATIEEAMEQIISPRVTRLIVTDGSAMVIYDSLAAPGEQYALLPEILCSLDGDGYDVFSWRYNGGVMYSRAAIPLIAYDTIVGCVYMMEFDDTQGILIQSLQNTVFRITLVLEAILVLFSIIFATRFSHRLRKIMASMRIIQQGDFSHKVSMSGNDELSFLGREFNDLTDRLNTSESKRRRFVSDASHELKTPLASIKLLTDSILQNDMDMDTVREFVGDIGDEAERLNRTTAKLLSLTKADDALVEDCEIINMAPTIRRVVHRLSPLAAQSEIELRLKLGEDCPVLILEDDLYQIAFNLVENGIKYNIPGGRLTVSLERKDDNAILQVTDTGMGIPADALEHIFERFYRVDKARSRATGGSGLGLSIVRTIVHRHRGEISVDSVPDQGTTFTVVFPIFDTEEEPQ